MKRIRINCGFIDRNINCVALKEPNCDGCTFFKTREELDESRKRAEDKLAAKGLKPCEKYIGEIKIMSVEKI